MQDSMTVSAPGPSRDAGWGNSNGFGDYNGGGSSGGGRQAANSSRYAVADLRLVKPGYPAPTFPIGGTINATVCTNVPENTFMNWGSYIDNAKPMAARLAGAAVRGTPLGRIGSFLMGLEEGRKEKAAQLQQQMIDKAKEDAARVNVTDVFHVTALPMAAIVATHIPMERIREAGKILADVVSQPVVDTKNGQRQIAITREPTEVSVVKAEKTSKPNVYSAQVVAGMKPMQITVDNSIPSSQLNKNQVNTASEVGIFSPTSAGDTHHAILDFDGKHEPIYISVSKVPTEAEKKAQLEEAKKREQEWAAANPLLAAELELDEADKELRDAEATVLEAGKTLDTKRNEPLGLTLANPEKYPVTRKWDERIEFPIYAPYAKVDFNFYAVVNSRENLNSLLEKGAESLYPEEVSWEDVFEKYAAPGQFLEEISRGDTEDVLETGSIYTEMAIEELNFARQKLLEQKRLIAESEHALTVAQEKREKAENKKKEKEEKAKKEKKRDQPGTATGDGTDVGEKWLEGVSKELGDPIPKEVAKKLKGKKFSSFDKFRQAIWTEIGKVPKLAQNIKTKANKKAIAKGRAPFARKKDQVGGRKKLELHHVEEIQHGGEVYDVDNLRIVTPKNHIKIHSK
ncbi:colicin-like bacteriocin tRNase domain-containing protein [Xenorhabdus sp. KJ12.1]|uniref:colicin-like bacteriocin tRNase domain-containing protein n=1 Tax=Xenorhabdus sp. KJ12.1 TaxID=1851571 RepID=UPI000C04AFDC|nr:colicin-like bacteriocin tRNase domain-containing protein [Xenorhabdus sp. KJ12.1]PHM69560.1 Uropathogenic specific protein [Xenorhabdus sp. KJ12.1]